MMKCGKAECACRQDPAKRHGPYFEWTYKAKSKTVNVKLTPEVMPMFRAASQQYRKLKSLLNRLERLPEFLATFAKTVILVKFLRDRLDLSRAEGTSLAA
jgi:hypothetical protein